MKTNTTLVGLAILFMCTLQSAIVSATSISKSRLLFGSVQFPAILNKVPDIRVYYGGHMIKTAAQHDTKQITFSIPIGTHQTLFHVLITKSKVDFNLAKNKHIDPQLVNTFSYLRVPNGQPYKLFQIEQIDTEAKTVPQVSTASVKTAAWHIKECSLTTNDLRMPDMTIMIDYDPDYVDYMQQSTSTVNLPTVHIKQNVIELAGGSEIQLHNQSHAIVLASIDIDTLHAPLNESIKHDKNRVLIAAPSA